MNIRMLSLAGALAGMLAGSGIAVAHTTAAAPPQVVAQAAMRGDRGSDRDLRQVRRRLEGIIDSLQRDQHDYSGHRVAAIRDLTEARQEIDAALAADRGH